MTISQRIRKVREVRGWKQTTIAGEMGITQQAYSCLEVGMARPRIDTLERFCAQMKVTVAFLVSDVPINETTIDMWGHKSMFDLVQELNLARTKISILQEIIEKK